ncbi:MAG: hypothetical protein Q9165_000240 [Trypethelium subeluteriae]
MVDNRTHQRRRKMLYKGFAQGFLRENWEGRLREQIEAAVMRIEEEAKTHADGEEPEFIKVITKIMQGGNVRADFPWLSKVLKRIPTESFGRIFRASSYVLEFATPAVVASKKEGGEANLFATMFANAEKDDEQLDDYDVRVEAANLIIAGSDTTAVTLTYLIWAVLQRPALRKALEDEVDKLPADFRDADIEKLPLLGAVMEETLRLYGAAPSTLPRTVPRGGTSLGGSKYFLPEGTTVGCQSYTFHRDPRLFPDPEKSESPALA